IGQIDSVYLYNLVQYQQVLKQRNQYLKQLAEKKQTDPLYLDILTEQLVTFGSKILWTRINFVKKLEYWANQLHQLISQEKETLTLHYDATVAFEEANLADIEAAYSQAFAAIRAKELFRQMTLIGPHRDELVFFINGKNVQTYGSQGQQRTTALSVKLAEIDLMKAETGEYPILLLDDVMSELDDSRQVHLLEAIEGKVQTFLTTTTIEHVRDKMTVQPAIYYVNQGKLEGEKTE
ncbi:MAG: DNA replication/repair protein RecF, partial [Enterococcus italicus]